MDANQVLSGNQNSAEQMLVLSAVILVAVAMLIVSNMRGGGRKEYLSSLVSKTPPDAERILVPTPATATVPATAAATPAPERA